MKKQVKAKSHAGRNLAIGAGVVAVAAATYFLFGPHGKKNQKKAKAWMLKMKGEVVHKLEDLENVTEPVYNKVVDGVAAAYMKAKEVAPAELRAYAKDMKKEWRHIKKAVPKKKVVAKKKK